MTEEEIAYAAECGLPVIDGLQSVATARRATMKGNAVNWYKLEDETEAVRDDDGNPAEWPA